MQHTIAKHDLYLDKHKQNREKKILETFDTVCVSVGKQQNRAPHLQGLLRGDTFLSLPFATELHSRTLYQQIPAESQFLS